MTADDDSTRAPPGARRDWQQHRAGGGSSTAHGEFDIEAALEPERYVSESDYAVCWEVIRDLREKLAQYEGGRGARGNVVDEINGQVQEAEGRLAEAYRRRTTWMLAKHKEGWSAALIASCVGMSRGGAALAIAQALIDAEPEVTRTPYEQEDTT